jgi:hypothetical protein
MEWNRYNLRPYARRDTRASARTWIFYNRQFYKPIIQFDESESTYVESPFR